MRNAKHVYALVSAHSCYMPCQMNPCCRVCYVSIFRSRFVHMGFGTLAPQAPLGRGVRDGTVDIAEYVDQSWPRVPIAIPSKGRERTLCEQTLQMLRSYEYDLSKVHVFVDATHVREDGVNEYDAYFKHLRDHGFGAVNVHPGGVGLMKQYDRIFAFFDGEPEVILTSDMVPRIEWRRRRHNVTLEDLPKGRLAPVIRVGFDLCRIYGSRAWSLSSCKAGLNLQAGHVSRKCGLLCGNFCGVRLDVGPPPRMTMCDFTTDVEFSLRCWAQDGAMIRFLGIAAAHKYRSPGGHEIDNPNVTERHIRTCRALQTLAGKFPHLVKYTGDEKRPSKAMNYRFLQRGPKKIMFKGTFTTSGRKPVNGWRHVNGAERQRQHRKRKKAIRPTKRSK